MLDFCYDCAVLSETALSAENGEKMRVLLSIKPKYAEKIFSGVKRYEFRKQAFKKTVDVVVLYATKPVGKIVGEFRLKSILQGSPDEIWQKTAQFSGISRDFFDRYYKNHKRAYALEIEHPVQYKRPVKPLEFMADFTAPQTYRYIP